MSEHLRRAGIKTRYEKRVELTDDEHGRAIEAALGGMSVKRIVTMVGATERVIARTLDAAQVKRRRSTTMAT
ncbi:MAG: hypothetical protein QM630_06320 [Microbacterium sp.]